MTDLMEEDKVRDDPERAVSKSLEKKPRIRFHDRIDRERRLIQLEQQRQRSGELLAGILRPFLDLIDELREYFGEFFTKQLGRLLIAKNLDNFVAVFVSGDHAVL